MKKHLRVLAAVLVLCFSLLCPAASAARAARREASGSLCSRPRNTTSPSTRAAQSLRCINALSSFPKETYTLSINAAAKSCKIFTKKLDNPEKVRYSLTKIQMLGWEVSNSHVPCRELPVGARQKEKRAAN